MQRKTVVLTAMGIGAFLLGRMIVNARKGRGLADSMESHESMSEDSFPASDAPSFTPVHTP